MNQLHQGLTLEQLLEMVERVQPCETCNSEREITQRGYDSDRAEVVPCPDCRGRK